MQCNNLYESLSAILHLGIYQSEARRTRFVQKKILILKEKHETMIQKKIIILHHN